MKSRVEDQSATIANHSREAASFSRVSKQTKPMLAGSSSAAANAAASCRESAARSGCNRSSRSATLLTRRVGWISYQVRDSAWRRPRRWSASASLTFPPIESCSAFDRGARFHRHGVQEIHRRPACRPSPRSSSKASRIRAPDGNGSPSTSRGHSGLRRDKIPARSSRATLAASSISSATRRLPGSRPTGTMRATGVLRSRTRTDSPDRTLRR